MPAARGRGGGGSGGGAGGDQGAEQPAAPAAARRSGKTQPLPILTDNNYPVWCTVLRNKAYGAGKEWDKMIVQSEQSADDDVDRP